MASLSVAVACACMLLGSLLAVNANAAPCGVVPAGTYFHENSPIYSCNHVYHVIWQSDGNLVVYSPYRALWASGTNGRATTSTVMQGDGNLVIYGYTGAIWATGTGPGHPGAWLNMQNDGNLVIYWYNGAGLVPIWASGTNGEV
jgi:hypothetical protein